MVKLCFLQNTEDVTFDSSGVSAVSAEVLCLTKWSGAAGGDGGGGSMDSRECLVRGNSFLMVGLGGEGRGAMEGGTPRLGGKRGGRNWAGNCPIGG